MLLPLSQLQARMNCTLLAGKFNSKVSLDVLVWCGCVGYTSSLTGLILTCFVRYMFIGHVDFI